MTTIAVALFEGAEELDFAGPWEVLAAWARQWPDDGVEVFTVAATTDPVTCAKGMRVLPDQTWETAPAIDVLVYPGGFGTRRELADEEVLDRLRGLRGGGTLMTSVCTGALVFASAGLLRDRPATRWSAISIPAETPAAVTISPLSTNRSPGRTSIVGSSSASVSRLPHHVVAGRSRRRPAAA